MREYGNKKFQTNFVTNDTTCKKKKKFGDDLHADKLTHRIMTTHKNSKSKIWCYFTLSQSKQCTLSNAFFAKELLHENVHLALKRNKK